MTIVGIGVDIEDISRFRKLVFDANKQFYNKIFSPKEIEYCLSKADPYQHFAARFCAKEAFVKATNKKNDYKSVQIEIKDKKPTIIGKDAKIHLSLSHDKDKAIAFVIVENE